MKVGRQEGEGGRERRREERREAKAMAGKP